MDSTRRDLDWAARNPRGRGPAVIQIPDFEVSVNGRVSSESYNAHSGERTKFFTVVPGQGLAFAVGITVAAPGRVTGLWLGIWPAAFCASSGGPVGMDPILHRTPATQLAGQHNFEFGWTVPADLEPGTSLSFGFALNGSLPGRTGGGPERLVEAAIAGPLARINVKLPALTERGP
jgi:hypothetical protein